jgi:hypothetical protein
MRNKDEIELDSRNDKLATVRTIEKKDTAGWVTRLMVNLWHKLCSNS